MRFQKLAPTLILLAGCRSDGSQMAALSAATLSHNVGDSTVVVRRLLVESGKNSFYPQAPTPDGRSLVGVDLGTRTLAIKDISTGAIRPIPTKAGFPTKWVEESIVSPDGKSVAFTWGETRQRYLLNTIGITGSNERTLFTPNDVLEYATPMDWTPDGREVLAYVRARDKTSQIAFLPASGGAMRVLKSLEWRASRGLRISPDGRAIAFDLQLEKDAGARDLFVLEADGSRESRITSDRQPKMLLGWSDDGRALVYSSESAGGHTIWRVALDSGRKPGTPEVVRADLFGFGNVRLQGSSLYYFVSGLQPAILTAPIDFENSRAISAPAPAVVGHDVDSYSPALWSSDGRQLAFLRTIASAGISQVTLALRHVESGEEPRLALELERARLSRWGPGNRTIVLSGWRRGQQSMFEVDLASGALTRIGDVAGATPRFRTPDGRFEYYIKRSVAPNTAAIMEVNLATNAERELHRVSRPNVPSLSPDGMTFAFRHPDSTGAQVLVLLSTRGEQPPITVRGLPREFAVESFTWTPDSRYLVRSFRTNEEQFELWSISVQSGAAGRLLQSAHILLNPHATPNGKVAVGSVVGDDPLELWVMENLRSSSTAKR